MIVLSHLQVAPMLKARAEGAEVFSVSLDLNCTRSEVRLGAEGVVFPDGQHLSWEALEEIHAHETACYLIQDNTAERIVFFSEAFQRTYSLLPTENAPTMLLAGFPMHRIKGIDPQEDTRRKIGAVAPIIGRVLDTATGLGYTAIEAAKTAAEVVTIELDPVALEVARRNPWSQELFTDSRIKQRIGDAFEVVQTLEDRSFDRILHDPPTFRLAGQLYSERFYTQLFRVLKRGGRLFHYIGDLDSASGRSVAKGVVRRLQQAGFQQVERAQDAFGLTARKSDRNG
ncbi:MAG TPA: methyltransferase domain-containing protein [Chthonomonadaceae bacterium]|nr:methyltransferase domain-containing protein [Chthonomonadaceae bacterium]